MPQHVWVVAYGLAAHLLCLKMIGNIFQGARILSYHFIAYFQRFKIF